MRSDAVPQRDVSENAEFTKQAVLSVQAVGQFIDSRLQHPPEIYRWDDASPSRKVGGSALPPATASTKSANWWMKVCS